MGNFADRLIKVCDKELPICVGLDPDPERFQPIFKNAQSEAANLYKFCFEIMDALKGIIPVIKPQSAFFEAWGHRGAKVLWLVLRDAHDLGYLTIVDAKRGDIGNTSIAYGKAYHIKSKYPSDAVTINPYLGSDSILPFVEASKKHGSGAFVLVKTSNKSSAEIQDLKSKGKPIYIYVAELVEALGKDLIGKYGYSSLGAVIGATFPEVLFKCRLVMPHAIFLLPGIGAQGGRVSDIRKAFDKKGRGGLIVCAREIIYAYQRKDLSKFYAPHQFAEAAREAALRLRDEVGEMLGSC